MVLLIFLTACSNGSQANVKKTMIIHDMAGREVEIKKDIQRVVAHQWGVADILVSVLGEEAMDKLVAVGVSKSSELVKGLYAENYPHINDMPNIGGGKSPYDVEMIVTLNPDIFIIDMTEGSSLEKTMDTINDLEKVGIPSIILNISDNPMTTPQEAITIVGEIFNKKERAKEITDFIDQQFELIRSKNLEEKTYKPTIYMEKGSGSSVEYDVTWSSGKGWGSIIEFAGGQNIVKDGISGSLQIDPEYLITQDPDFIVLAGAMGFGEDKDKGTAILDEYSKRKGWDQLQAVQNGNFYEISHGQERNQMCFFPTLFLAKVFNPEEFADIEPTEILREFYNKFMLLDFERGVWSVQKEAQ